MKEEVKELLEAYLDSSAEFSKMLKERTQFEVAYDSEVVAGLRAGHSISEALKSANEKYPTEGLQWDNDTIVEIKAHYEYLMNHEDIVSKLKNLSAKK